MQLRGLLTAALAAAVTFAASPSYGSIGRSATSRGGVMVGRPVTSHWTPPPPSTVILPMGDSITSGVHSTSGDGYRAALSDQLAQVTPARSVRVYVGSQISGSRGYHHEGYPGATINQIASHIPAGLAAASPYGRPVSLVLWDAGSNDDGQGRTAQQMLNDTSAALDRFLAASPTVKVLVAQITLTPYNPPSQQQAENDFDNQLPALAAAKGNRVAVVDMRGVEISDDLVHPGDAGYADMATRWRTALTANRWLP